MKVDAQKLIITPQMQWEASIHAAEDYCKLMNGRSTYNNATGNLRSSCGYAVKGDTLVVAEGAQPIYSVELPHIDDENENQ